ncbi:uncharacterized protein LOC139918646 isoform X1 [Centroberyx gerrardi]
MASKDMTLKWLQPSVKPSLTLFIIAFAVIQAPCGGVMLNCSRPDPRALLEALAPVFKLKSIRPVMDMSTRTTVSTHFILYGILGVDEKAQLLTTYIWLTFEWPNEFVSWDPIQCGADQISLPRDNFWVPDVVINEFMDKNTAPFVPYVYLHHDGEVHDALPVRVVSSCNLNIYTFPFDVQNCTLTFNSYTHVARDVRMNLGKAVDDITKLSKEVMTTMGEWQLLDISYHKYVMGDDDNEDDIYDELAFHITVRRRATLYVVNLLIPSCFLITVDLFSFLLPPQSVDRSSFKMTLILGYTVFLLIMNDLLPITGNTIPLINVFFSLCLALMVASLLETILITNLLCGSSNFSPVPRWVRVLILHILGRLVRLPPKPKEQTDAEVKPGPVAAQQSEADGKPPEQMGPAVEDKTLQELRRLGKDLQAIRLQVEQQLTGNQSSEDWIQRCPLTVKPSKVLFIFISVLMHAPCSAVTVNCSRPDPPALLEALGPVFDLSPIRPVRSLSTPTTINISFTLFGILGVDEKAQVLSTYIWQRISWTNEFVSWDPDQCGASRITLPRKKLWVPDLVINEFMAKNSAPFVPYVYLWSDGTVKDFQPVKVLSSCRLDIYNFPFDIQNCTFTFNSYFHRMSAVQMKLTVSAEDILRNSKDVITTMGEWELVGIRSEKYQPPASGKEHPSDDPYDKLRFYITVRRRATLYVVNILIPSCFLIAVDLFSFLLPPQSVDRSSFKMTLILGYTVFLLMMSDLLPITGNTIPLMNVFLSLCLALMVASLLETILITNLLCGSSNFSPVPRWVRVLVLHILGRLVRLPPKPRDPGDTIIQNPAAQEMKACPPVADGKPPEDKGPAVEDEALEELRRLGKDLQAVRLQVEQQLTGNRSSEDWNQVGFIIDRLLFGLYILFISISFITITCIWVQSYSIV